MSGHPVAWISGFLLVALLAAQASAQTPFYQDPGFHADFKKLSGFEVSPLMPEGLEKAVRQLPRDPEVIELFKQIAGANPLPSR